MQQETDQLCIQMTALQKLMHKISVFMMRIRHKFPYLIWRDEEIDVRITLSQDKLDPNGDPFKQLFGGAFSEIEKTFLEMGISFDVGMGECGRDWEWDWSLKGPISVRFRNRATKPEIRMERKRPRLVVNNRG